MSQTAALEGYLRFVPPPVVRRYLRDPSPPTVPTLNRFPAAVMFADVSGFTPLAEMLAQRGPEGAELLTRTLNGYFGQMLEILTRHGGEVIEFAGDAMVILWPADDLPTATLLAAQAGESIQKELHDYPVLEGRTLSLHVGIGAGDVVELHVGGQLGRWKYVTAGGALQQMADAEHLSSPGTVVLSPQAWRLIQTHCRGKELETGFALLESVRQRQPMPPRVAIDLDDRATASLEAYIHLSMRAALESGQAEWVAELRRVTVLFVNVIGLDYSADDVLDRIQRCVEAVQSVLFHYEGSITQLLVDDKGTVLVAAVGLPPLAHEDDAFRGVRAAIDLSGGLRDMGLRTAIGVTTGRVFCGPVGSSIRSCYTMMGDVVNTAARLMQAAENDILCDPATYQATSSRIEFERLPSLRMKGKKDPVDVYRPAGEVRHRKRLQRMFGRDVERAQLSEHLTALHQGKSGAVVIEANPGLGKSRLVADIVDQAAAAGVRWFLGAADAVEQTTPYLAFRTILRWLCPKAAGLNDWFADEPAFLRLLPLLNEVIGVYFPPTEYTQALTGRTRAENMQRLLVRIMQKAADSGPLLVVLEDGHWLDSASWMLAVRISQEVRPLLLILSTRPMDDPPAEYRELLSLAPTQEIRLETLPADDIVRLVCERLKVESLPRQAHDFILKRGGGSPFFTEELAYTLRDSGAIEIKDGVCRLAAGHDSLEAAQIPDTLQGVITSRIDRLTSTEQLMLKAASVIGRTFLFEILHSIYPVDSERDALGPHLDMLVRADLTTLESVSPNLSYTFKHVIIQEVAYGQMLFAQRRQLHAAVAEWVETRASYHPEAYFSILAHHWMKAENIPRAVEYLEKAGEQALRSGAYREACTSLKEVLRLGSSQDVLRTARRERLLGAAHGGLGQNNESRVHLERTLQLLRHPMPSNLLTLTGRLLLEALRQLVDRVRTPRQGKEREALLEAAQACEGLLEVYYLSEEPVRTMFVSMMGLNLAEDAGPSPELARLNSANCLAMGLVPWPAAAEHYAWRAQVVSYQVRQLEVYGWVSEIIGLYSLGRGQLLRADEHLKHASKLFDSLGDKRHWFESTCVLAERYLYQGYMKETYDTYSLVLEATEEGEDAEARLWCLTAKGLTQTIMGHEPEVARRHYEEARALLEGEKLGPLEQILYHGEMALVSLFRGDTETALRSAATAIPLFADKLPTALSSYEGRFSVTEAVLKLWEREPSSDIKALAIRATASLRRFAAVFPIARCRAAIWQGLADWLQGRRSRARAGWQRALAWAQQADLIFDQALAHREIGRHLPENHSDRAAHLKRANELFLHCSAAAYVED